MKIVIVYGVTLNFSCQISGSEGRKCMNNTSQSNFLYMNCHAVGTSAPVFNEKFGLMNTSQILECSMSKPLCVSSMMVSCGCLGPDQNISSYKYIGLYFSLNSGKVSSLNAGTFCNCHPCDTFINKTINNDISRFSLEKATRHFSAQHSYCQSFIIMPLNSCQFTQYAGYHSLNTSDMKTWVQEAHLLVKNSQLPNYKQARVVVPLGLNIENWRRYLQPYHIKVLFKYLKFGCPLKIDREIFRFNTYIKNYY